MVLLLIAVSLSMDAFSLSLAYGTLGLSFKDKLKLVFMVGVFHFFMPLLGFLIGGFILNNININPHIIVFFILLFIGLEMIVSSFKEEEEVKMLKFSDILLFSLAVSVDSFSLGITLTEISNNLFSGPVVFALTSAFFTYLGLSLGNKIERLMGKTATFIGGLVLVIVGISFVI